MKELTNTKRIYKICENYSINEDDAQFLLGILASRDVKESTIKQQQIKHIEEKIKNYQKIVQLYSELDLVKHSSNDCLGYRNNMKKYEAKIEELKNQKSIL